MEEKVLIVKYGEIAMRGSNRSLFVSKLVTAIRRNLDPAGNFFVVKEQGRLIVEDRGGEMDYDSVIPRVTCVLGVIGVCPGVKTTDQSMEHLREVALKLMRQVAGEQEISFKVETKRSDKRFPIPSREVSADLGGYILERMPHLTVNVRCPEKTLFVELRNDAYLYTTMFPAFGGLPAGTTGKGVALLSGGIDSPVAAFLMAKRGVEVAGVYFHSPPYTSERAKQKVLDLAERLAYFTGQFRLYVVPFTEVQLYLLEQVPKDKLTIFLKRAMTKIAEQIAVLEGAQGLITGDSVGQVASQTMQALHAVSSAAELPILRPLAGFDKQEIVDLAKKIDTFSISIRPYEDCCTLFVAKHPETKPKTSVIEKIEANLPELPTKLNGAREMAEIIEF